MATTAHLWAIGYDDVGRAEQARSEIVALGWDKHYLILNDVALIVRHADGSFTLEREKFPTGSNILGCTAAGFLAGLVIGTPFTGATIGALLGSAGSAVAAPAGIDNEFVEDVKRLMKPGTAALFVLDSEGQMDVILRGIRGLGGTVLRTNVDVERAKLIQSTLAATADKEREPGGQ